MNKNYLFFPTLFIVLISSCQEPKPQQEQKKEVSYSIDTVRVDSKDEILFLNYFLNISSLDGTGDFLYNFNVPNTKLEKINLNTLELDSIISLDKEGPDGIGIFPSRFKVLKDGSYLFYNGYNLINLDPTGKKTTNITFQKEDYITNSLPKGTEINIQSSNVSADGNYYAGVYGNPNYGEKPDGIMWVDLKNKQSKLIPTKELDFITENNILLTEGGNRQGANTSIVFFEPSKDQIILSTSARNNLMIYDLEKDTLEVKDLHSTLTRDAPVPRETIAVEDMQEFHRLRNERQKEVLFGNWYLDKETGNRWRFSKELDKVVGEDSLVFKNVLTGIDSKFNFIGETQIPSEIKFPYSTRFRKGMFYLFLNENDELAFVRIKPIIKNE